MTEYKHLRNPLTGENIVEKHVWPRGWARLLLLAPIAVNLSKRSRLMSAKDGFMRASMNES